MVENLADAVLELQRHQGIGNSFAHLHAAVIHDRHRLRKAFGKRGKTPHHHRDRGFGLIDGAELRAGAHIVLLLHRLHGGLDMIELVRHAPAGVARACGQVAHFRDDHGKRPAGLPGMRRLDGGVERQQSRLQRKLVDFNVDRAQFAPIAHDFGQHGSLVAMQRLNRSNQPAEIRVGGLDLRGHAAAGLHAGHGVARFIEGLLEAGHDVLE